jgi:hypothetical protein
VCLRPAGSTWRINQEFLHVQLSDLVTSAFIERSSHLVHAEYVQAYGSRTLTAGLLLYLAKKETAVAFPAAQGVYLNVVDISVPGTLLIKPDPDTAYPFGVNRLADAHQHVWRMHAVRQQTVHLPRRDVRGLIGIPVSGFNMPGRVVGDYFVKKPFQLRVGHRPESEICHDDTKPIVLSEPSPHAFLYAEDVDAV